MAEDAASDASPERTRDLKGIALAHIDQGETLYKLGRMFWADFGRAHVPVDKDTDLVAQHFPRSDILLRSPAFLWPDTVQPGFARGTASPTDEATYNRFIRGIESRNPWMYVNEACFASDEGHHFTYILLSSSATLPKSDRAPSTKLRVWIQSGVHGNEPAGEQAVLALLGKMDTDQTWASSILEAMDIMIFPRYNPDGISAFNRCGGFGFDSNRDHMRFEVSHSKHIRELFCDFAPHIAIDMHEYSARARHGQLVHGADIMFSAAKNLNIHPEIRRLSEELFLTNIDRKLTASHFRWEPYVPGSGTKLFFHEAGSEGRIGRNAMGLTQCISFLCESRGIGIADQHFHRRTAASLTFLESILEVTVSNHDQIKHSVEEAVRHFVQGQRDIVVLDKPCQIDRTFTLIDRVTAYMVPSSMNEIAQRLTDLGLVIQKLDYAWTGIVEKLTADGAVLGKTFTDGVVPMKVTTSTKECSMTLQKGAFLIDTRQRNAALAFIALEPENVDSYVSMNIITVVKGEEYPIYRAMYRPDL